MTRPHAPTWASLFAGIQVEQVEQRRLYNDLAGRLGKMLKDIEYLFIILREPPKAPTKKKRKKKRR